MPVLSTAKTELERNEKYWEPEEVAFVVELLVKKASVVKRRESESVVVADTRPFSSVAKRALVSPVMCKFVVVALTAMVEEAMSWTPFSQREVVVDCTAVPA